MTILDDLPVLPDEDRPGAGSRDQNPEENQQRRPKRTWGQIWDSLLRLGLGELSLRIGTGLASIVLVLLVTWVMGNFYLKGKFNAVQEAVVATLMPTEESAISLAPIELPEAGNANQGITRLITLHTIIPARPRFDVTSYEVQKGDTIFGIAGKFNLRPETILWGNYYILADDPHSLRPGQKLNILPVDGVYYEWHAGDGLNGVAKYYGVKVEDIVNWPGNRLNPETIGDYANPNITQGTWLVIPGGKRDFINWSMVAISRKDPAVAKIMGPGYCGQVVDGPVGTGTFIWPTVEHYISGFDYSPETNHYGIDIAGNEGYAIFAADSGVVVYAGWHERGYGNVIVIDHGSGWQSLYAHLSALNVVCGSPVIKGDVIGAMGTTGNSSGAHLHFELRSDQYGRPNPHNFIQ